MTKYFCTAGLGINHCDRKFETLSAARIHNQQDGHSVLDTRGTPIDEYPECDG